jgi:hypothetical protein
MTPTHIPSVCSFIHFDLTSSPRIEIACTLQPVLDFRRKQKEKIARGKKKEKKKKK